MARMMRWPLPWPKSWRTREAHAEAPPGQGIEGGEADEEEEPRSFQVSAILFARDLGVALLVVVIVMLVLLAYTQVWPPMVVVESRSMQHSNTESFIGVIDTGDLVLVQDVVVPTDIVPWVEGRATGHRTYSDFGDVIIFLRPTQAPGSTPIIHRAYAFVIENATRGADVPSLARLPPGTWDALSATNGTSGAFAYGIWEFTLRDAGWQGDRTLRFNATSALTRAGVTSGFLTKGVNNPDVDPYGAIHVDRVLGKARGELPWFGLIKLTLAPGESGCCRGWGDTTAPKNSWDALIVSLILIIVGPFAVDYGWAWFNERRKARRRAAKAMAPAEPPPPEPAESIEDAPRLGPADTPPSPEPDVTDEARTGSSGPEDGDP